jgi:hypothetical protein
MNESTARGLLRQAVILNIKHRNCTGLDWTRFSEERDEIVADLEAAHRPFNYQDYSHPSEV